MARPLFSAPELARLRHEAEASMLEPVVIRDPAAAASVSDGMGGKVRGQAPELSTTVCRVSPGATEAERLIADQVKAREFVVVALPFGTGVRATHELEVRGKRYAVLAVVPAQTYSAEQRVIAREA